MNEACESAVAMHSQAELTVNQMMDYAFDYKKCSFKTGYTEYPKHYKHGRIGRIGGSEESDFGTEHSEIDFESL